jgi:hypothetical protein
MARERTAGGVRGRRQRASATLMSLCLMTALGIALGSYLALSTRSAQFSNRFLQAERAQQLAQVGLEEALWALNENTWTASGPDGTNAWTTSGANRTVTLTYPLSGSGGSGTVVLTVANYASAGPTWPTITSNATVTLPGGEVFTKSLQATAATLPLFGNAIASAEAYVSFAAGGTVDSWNSDPDNNSATAVVAYSFTAGNPTNYSAVVAGRTNGACGVILTQATVRGYVATFGEPVSYSTSASPAASIVGPSTAESVKIDTARIGKSAFVPLDGIFSATAPAITGPNFGGPLATVAALANALFSAPAAIDMFKCGDFVINGGLLAPTQPNISVARPITLIVDGNFVIENIGQLTITETGALKLFVSGDVTIGGNGIRNLTKDPKKLAIFCSSSSTTDSLEYTTSENFCGVIFCENKPIDIRQNATFEGALLSRQWVRFSDGATSPVFHYDTSLRNTRFDSIKTPYVVKQVTEI